MNTHPIIFSAPMVRAIISGRKNQTRRVVKPQPPEYCSPIEVGRYPPTVVDRHGEEQPGAEIFGAYDLDGEWGCRCPYGQPGELLWVRETFIAGLGVGGYAPGVDPDKDQFGKTIDVIYRADDGENERTAAGWQPSIHMPRWASRLTLEITDVRVERVQDISQQDCFSEGLKNRDFNAHCERTGDPGTSCQDTFAELWDSINAKRGYGWDVNPWVWALTFKAHQMNIDAMSMVTT